MQVAFLADAEPAAVSHAVRDVLERRGALVSEHVSSRILFRSAPAPLQWTRAGYVGVYQRLGEREVQLRVILRALWPYRVLWTIALLDLVGALATFVVNPSGTTWFLVAFVEGLALLVAGLTYLNTWTSVGDEEQALMRAFEEELQRTHAAVEVEDADARAAREAEADLAGEVERRRLAEARKAAPAVPLRERKMRLDLRFGRKKGE